ncbi:MAG: peptide chain release factor 1 [Deltaproteobacteria bacterium RIFCSPLOWO2_01_44_7]|nr:MAG: peptide chain release factor 1 [Deltaproteobacteria bacterium RIFCSPHIGHO2_01_FULL_43_49]OGQ14472.1 MAG: peptide chain release factor 1 [Deltaproteobacteria bacterium RIFCSPHIGHO2_02_FULL_44_53]OGQ27853.1 MAG: peptide chain release factor 1 [Deltaproteobacteria bacterium RIFCSPHIGHO2_12_FULL_44_21]OGQ30929.1 MAG: peptide chain release factor 1 [Deltaproteobacteria bacterium RIFCSPLOWO2_01_FULL_45_74]OGQ38970.1 MAG: peptide chain release factor 1 [Deltaproteobacteria bacterium RIFCSPLOWO
MFNRLEQLVKRYNELNEKLSDPKVIADNLLFQKLSKESSDLVEPVKTYRQYQSIQKHIHQNKELVAHEKDAEIQQMAKEELPELETNLKTLEEKLKILLLPKDPHDDKNVFLEIRAGTGGDEAALFASDLFRMYSKYAESLGWKIEIVDSSSTGIGGLKEIIVQVNGKMVYSDLKYESGIHRVQRVPETEQQGRVHTSAVTVAVLPEPDEVEVQIDEKDLRIDTYSAGGPGGQHVNKTQSAVRITHIPTNLVVTCQDDRSQHKNKARAMKVLKVRLYDKMLQEQQAVMAKTRKGMVGSGDRSEKIRTYNFPQNRLTDHRIGLTLYQLDKIMDGHLEEVIPPLRTHFQTEALKSDKG